MDSLFVAQFTVLDDRYVTPRYDWQGAFEFPRHFESEFEVNPWTEIIGCYTDQKQAQNNLFEIAHDLLHMFYKNAYGKDAVEHYQFLDIDEHWVENVAFQVCKTGIGNGRVGHNHIFFRVAEVPCITKMYESKQ